MRFSPSLSPTVPRGKCASGSSLITGSVEGMPWMRNLSFHRSKKILRRHAEVVGLTPNFTILDTDDQIRLIKLGGSAGE